jgi:putative CRISPR-associated protein (TIGR02620 family)
MISRITRDVLESYLRCKYKGYLKWTGQQGIKSDQQRRDLDHPHIKIHADDRCAAGVQLARQIAGAAARIQYAQAGDITREINVAIRIAGASASRFPA